MGSCCTKSYLKEKDYDLLETKFGKTRDDIDRIFAYFKENCLNGQLNKRQFEELLSLLWSESIKSDGLLLDTIFSAFDSNGSGYVTLEEFLLTCSEEEKFENSAIEAAFNAYYDKDRKGSINYDKLKSALNDICKSYPGYDEELSSEDIEAISQEFFDNLSKYSQNPNEITKESFIKAVTNNPLLASFMIPSHDESF